MKLPASNKVGLPLKGSVSAVCGSGKAFRKVCADEDGTNIGTIIRM
jgi:hypothetical protein